MTVTIVGITGNLGRCLTEQGLERGLSLRGVARGTRDVEIDSRVKLYTGSAMDDAVLLEAFRGADAVVSVFAANIEDPWRYGEEIKNVLKCAKLAGVPRVVGLVGSAGTYVSDTEHLVDTDYFQETTRHFYQNVHAGWDAYRQEKELDWTVIVPAARMETHLPYRGGVYRVRTDERLVVTDESSRRYFDVSQISYADCAHALLDEVENRRYPGKFVTVGY